MSLIIFILDVCAISITSIATFSHFFVLYFSIDIFSAVPPFILEPLPLPLPGIVFTRNGKVKVFPVLNLFNHTAQAVSHALDGEAPKQ